jgi:pyruvate/2-oxoacid:ferredoxin oxidoreductase alpha subunit
MQEGLSYLAGAELPCVVVDITRGGPGLGNIAPEQSDYHQIVKGGGHGNYRTIVLAPHSVQEMCDLTVLAFDLADRYRTPVVIMTDGFIGQMMEPVEFPSGVATLPEKPWAVRGTAATRPNLITSIYMTPEDLERHVSRLEAKYARAARDEVRSERYRTVGAEILLVGHGIVARILETAVDRARDLGIQAGLLRPVTLWPFPARELAGEAEFVRSLLTVELSNGQLVEDVRLAVAGRRPVRLYSRVGGMVPTTDELLQQIINAHEADHVRQDAGETEESLWGV